MQETFGDLPCVTGIAHNIVVKVYNSDFNNHDENLRAVFQCARQIGLRFNLDKCKFRCTRIPLFNHIISPEGLLTPSESRYSNTARDMLAVLFGLEMLHYYAYGRPAVVGSDHKPLEAIFRKHLSSAPLCIARTMLDIQKYDAQTYLMPCAS